MSSTLVPCLICGNHLAQALPDSPMQPSRGLMCVAYGNFGSQVFDSFKALGHIAFIVCDECALERQERFRLARVTKPRPTTDYLDASYAFAPEELPEDDE